VSFRYVLTLLFSDCIHEPSIIHEIPQRPIYLAIHMKFMIHLKRYIVNLGLKSVIDAFIGVDEQYDIMAF
jgi:hypothetical protein